MSLNDQMIQLGVELKFTEKRLDRSVLKLQGEYNKKDKLLVAAMKKGNHDHAKVHAESMVRIKKDIKFTQILAAKVSGMRMKLNQARLTQQVTANMCKLSQALQSEGIVNVEAVTKVIDTFESATEKIEVMEEVVDHTMSKAAAKYSAVDDVDALIAQVADENALELATLLPQVSARVKQSKSEEEEEEDFDDLELPSVPATKPRSMLV